MVLYHDRELTRKILQQMVNIKQLTIEEMAKYIKNFEDMYSIKTIEVHDMEFLTIYPKEGTPIEEIEQINKDVNNLGGFTSVKTEINTDLNGHICINVELS